MSGFGFKHDGNNLGRVPVVITECIPELHDGTILELCKERFGADIAHFELISVANLRHLVKNGRIMRSLVEYIEGFSSRMVSPGTLVVSHRGTHKPLVRALRSLGLNGRTTGGITRNVGSRRNTPAAMIAWSNWLIHGEPALQTSLAKKLSVSRLATITVPIGIQKIDTDPLWRDYVIDQLKHLQEWGLQRVLLVGDVLRFHEPLRGFVPVGDIIATQNILCDALPGLAVDLGVLSEKDESGTLGVELLRFLHNGSVDRFGASAP